MKFIFIIIAMLWVGILSASPLEEIKLEKGMKREKAEELIANALGEKSTYNIYSMNREKENKYNDKENLLIVNYKPGFPAPWISLRKVTDSASGILPIFLRQRRVSAAVLTSRFSLSIRLTQI